MVEEMYQQEAKEEDDDDNTDEDRETNPKQITTNPLSQTPTPPTSSVAAPPPSAAPLPKRPDHPAENDPSAFSQNQANPNIKHQQYSSSSSSAAAAPPPPMVAHCFPATHYDSDLQDTCRRVSVLASPDHQFGTTSGSATSDIPGPTTLIRFGTTAGDVSLTLGLRHTGNIPDNNSSFSLRSEFGGC